MSDDTIPTTKESPGSYDAIATAKPDEPLFPVQGGDPFGPPTVLHWVKLAREEGIRLTSEYEEGTVEHKRGEWLLEKASMAEQVAWAMQAYQRGEEQVEGGRATYNDQSISVEELEDGRKMREALIKGAARLHNILAGANEIADVLAALNVHPEEEASIRSAVLTLQQAAFAIEPRRGNERT